MADPSQARPAPLALTVNGKMQTLSGAPADLIRLILKFSLTLSDEDFNATFIYRIHHGKLVESKFDVV